MATLLCAAGAGSDGGYREVWGIQPSPPMVRNASKENST